jgi:hypothetical protein
MKKDDSGPFGKASFEETMDNFLNAAARGEIEPTKGVSASIICGKRATIGTGMIGLRVDIERLPKGRQRPAPVMGSPSEVMPSIGELLEPMSPPTPEMEPRMIEI